MKKTIQSLVLCFLIAQFSFGQVKVSDAGNVGIQVGTSTPLSALSIGGVGSSTSKVYIYNSNTGINVKRSGTSSGTGYASIFSSDVNSSSYSIGVRADASAASILNDGRAWGVFSSSGNATSGYNYGVMGILSGTGNGAGIVGTINGNYDVNVPGKYAGYFVGDVKVNGIVTSTNITSSDRRLKDNIEKIKKDKNIVDAVSQLNPVAYNYKQRYIKTMGDSVSVSRPYYDENSQLFKKKQFGLIAQEVQAIYPELVYEDQEGYLAINYTGMIPLLIESIKELKLEIEELKNSKNIKAVSPTSSTITVK